MIGLFCPGAVIVTVSFDGQELVDDPYALEAKPGIFFLPTSRVTGQSPGLEGLFGPSNLLPFWLVGQNGPPLRLRITGQTFHHHFLGEGDDPDSYTVRVQPTHGRITIVRLDRVRARGFRIVDQQCLYPSDQPPVLIYDLEPARCRLIIHLAPTTNPFALDPPAARHLLELKLQRSATASDDLIGSFRHG